VRPAIARVSNYLRATRCYQGSVCRVRLNWTVICQAIVSVRLEKIGADKQAEEQRLEAEVDVAVVVEDE
jgi:hypothetical protein